METKLEIALTKCFYCGKKNRIIMNSILTTKCANKVKEMHNKVIDMEPCEECKEWMKKGIIFISVRDGESGNNPYRTGKWCVIKTEAIQRFPFSKELKKTILKHKFCFIEDSFWDKLGLS